MKKEQTVRICDWSAANQSNLNKLLDSGWLIVSITSSCPAAGATGYDVYGKFIVVFEREV